jgi:hypothetical protein
MRGQAKQLPDRMLVVQRNGRAAATKGMMKVNDESLPKPQPPASPAKPGQGSDEQTFFEKH